jgi:SLT domain-containing protein/phage-related minor tail protein
MADENILGNAFLRLQADASLLAKQVKEAGSKAEDSMKSSGDAAGNMFSGAFGKVMKGGAIVASVAALGAAAGAAFSKTFGGAIEKETSTAKAQAQLGLSAADAAALGGSAGKLYAQAYGDSFGSVTDALAVVKSSLKGLGADELEAATKKAMSFSQAFEIDMTRAVSSANTLIGSGLVKNSTEAFDLITKASQSVPAALREDVLDASDEYGQMFHQLGFDADTAFGALTKASSKGAFGIDKTGDAIKEFTILSTDMSTSSVEAYGKLGLNASEMANAILAGGDSAQTATQKIVSGLQGITDPAEQANTAIALFGTPLEDLGVGAIPDFLASISGASEGLGDFAGAADAVDATLGGTIDAKFTSFKRSIEGLGTSLGSALLPFFAPVIDGLSGLATKAGEFVNGPVKGAIELLASGDFKGDAGLGAEDSPLVNALFTARETFLSAKGELENAWSILAGGDYIGGLGGEDSPLVDMLFKIRDVGIDALRRFSGIWDTLKDTAKELWPSIKSIAESLFDAFTAVQGSGFDLLGLAWDALLSAAEGLADILKMTLVPAFEWIADFMEENPEMILIAAGAFLTYKGIMLGVTVAAKAFVIAQGLATAAVRLFNLAMSANPVLIVVAALAALVAGLVYAYNNVDWFREGVDAAWTWIKEAFQAALDFIQPILVQIGDFFVMLWGKAQPIFDFFVNSWNNFLAVIQGVINTVVGVFTGDWSRAWEGIKGIFGGIWDQIKNIVTLAFEAIKLWFTELIPTLWGLLSGFWSTILGWGTSILGWVWDGMKAIAGSVWDWFLGIPGWIWERLVTLTDTVIGYGFAFLGWILDGIEKYAPQIWDWFVGLPGMIWTKIQGAFTSVASWGSSLMKSIIEGIKASAPYVSQALLDVVGGLGDIIGIPMDGLFKATGVTGSIDTLINDLKNQASAAASGYGGRGSVDPMYRADGGPVWRTGINGRVLGPGGPRSDSIPTMLSNGEFVVNAKQTSRALPILQDINAGRFADGGLIGSVGKYLGASIMGKILPAIVGKFKDGVAASSAVSSNGNWGPENPSGLAANTAAARDFIMQKWGIRNIGGWRASGSVSASDHPKGKALDVMIANYLSATGIAQGNSVADWFVNNANAYGTKYVIWRDRINQNGAWSPYSHPGGNNDTLAHRDHVHLSFLSGNGAFAANSNVDSGDGNIFSKLASAVSSKISSFSAPAPISGGAFAPMVERWRNTVLQGLQLIGQPSTLANTVLNQIRSESSGNERAINLTDSNARKGTPSKGLIQTIDPTFQAYRLPSLANDPYNPIANIVAGMRYAISRYGSIQAGMRGVAYDTGGVWPSGTAGINLTGADEYVLKPEHWKAAKRSMDYVEGQANSNNGPLVGTLTIQSSGNLHNDLNEVNHQLRAIKLGGGRYAR